MFPQRHHFDMVDELMADDMQLDLLRHKRGLW